MSFGELLRGYRTAAGFSQGHLANLARVSVEAIGALERGTRRAPYRETVDVLALALNLDDNDRAKLEAAAKVARTRRSQSIAAPADPQHLQLPLQSTSLIGRDGDIDGVTALLEQSRLVTITGSGGVGKTRLAIEVAAGLPPEGTRDIRFVDLTRLTDGTLIAGAIAATFGIPDDSASTGETLVQALGPRDAFIVLDNCEHLIGEVALLAAAILRSCPKITLLAASRERLAVNGEVVYRLPSLALPAEAPASLAVARRYSGVDLFIQRSAAIDHTIRFGAADIESIVEICRRLDGIPLAIELAAARVAVLGLDALRRRLREGIAISAGLRNLPARQQTMQATIAWSYELLAQGERHVLQALSLFIGGFPLAAAESVCGARDLVAEDIADILSSLVDKSLVHVTRSGQVPRFALLDSVRSFAYERLRESGGLTFYSDRHAQWVAAFADWVDASRSELSERRLRTDVDPELENARAALTWALATESEAGTVLAGRIAGGLRTIWLASRRFAECRRWATAVLDGLDETSHPHITAAIMRILVQTSARRELLDMNDRAVRAFERIGDHMALALLHCHVAQKQLYAGSLTAADAAMEKASRIMAERNLPRTMPYATLLNYRARLRLSQGRYSELFTDLDEMDAISSAIGGDAPASAIILRVEAEHAVGETRAAIDRLERSIERTVTSAMPFRPDLLRYYVSLANLRILHDETALAESAMRNALRYQFAISLTDDYFYHIALDVLGLIAARRGNHRLAARIFGKLECLIANGEIFDREMQTPDQECHALLRDALRAALPPKELERLVTEGSALTMEAALAEAQDALFSTGQAE